MKLITFPASYGEPAGSPFATKAMMFLEASGQAYSVEYLNDPRKMPKGKLPVLKIGERMIPDSEEIREYLEQQYGCDFDANLNNLQKAQSRAIIRMVDEHMYFIVYADRWIHDHNWEIIRATAFDDAPRILRGFISNFVRKGAIKQIMGQGTGRHSHEERLERFSKDVYALSVMLGDQNYLFGDAPSAADMSAVTALRFTCAFPAKNDLNDCINSYDNLVSYMDRGKRDMYPK